ncbi:putative RNA exonuclease 4 [Podospora fimiseda]|uniref:RNA exonuclease 4 n=1 Tax=Podospora fimiseda TaxID=252190 RepID=A0AAN7BUJ7_9PEZI|nr:putative RNA exonuclease 4 [Podospora fimiseda]
MAPELSQNWKILQARLKAASPSTNSPAKRKASSDEPVRDSKKQKKTQQLIAKPSKLKPSSSQKMGAAHSTLSPLNTTKSSALPSLQLLTSKHDDITAESLAEAYSLGISASSLKSLPTTPNEGLSPAVNVDTLGKYLAIDCEMVGVGPGGHESTLARVSITDFHGKQVYDSYVKPREKVTDWRTHVSGIQPKHMHIAREFQQVQEQVAELLKGRIVVGHDVKHDFKVLELDHSSKMMRDTAKFSGFKKYGHGPKPALKVLAREILGVEIQQGQHSSIEDARVAMMLFRKHKSAFDVEHANKFPDEVQGKKKVNFKGKAKKARRG